MLICLNHEKLYLFQSLVLNKNRFKRDINLAKLDTSRQLTVPTLVSGFSTVNLFIYINKIIVRRRMVSFLF